jgi:DNA-binding CsgD family transcriptional regulator
VLVEMWTGSSMNHDVSKKLTAKAREVVKLLADSVKAAANVDQPAPSLAIEDISPSSDDNYQLNVKEKYRVQWSVVITCRR